MQVTELAQRIADRGRLDLDHHGPKIGESFADKRTGDELTELQDLEPGEGPMFQFVYAHEPFMLTSRRAEIGLLKRGLHVLWNRVAEAYV